MQFFCPDECRVLFQFIDIDLLFLHAANQESRETRIVDTLESVSLVGEYQFWEYALDILCDQTDIGLMRWVIDPVE